MTPVQVVNLSLSEIGQRIFINALTDNSPAAQVAQINYTPRIQALLRAAKWDFARKQVTLTQYKAAVINGSPSANPPPQSWQFEYLRPPDCLMARFLLPTALIQPTTPPLTTAPNNVAWVPPAPTGIPFVIGSDLDAQGNPISVIFTNLALAQLVYTADLSQTPDLWDGLFLSAATSYLGCYLIQALARNQAQYQSQVAQTKGLMDQARVQNGNEGIGSIDHKPDWLRARMTQGFGSWGQWAGYGYGGGGGWGGLSFPGDGGGDGLRY